MAVGNFKDDKNFFFDKKKSIFPKYIYILLTLLIVGFIFYVSSSRFIYAWQAVSKNVKTNIITKAATVVSETIGDVAKTDVNGNVNFLLVGVGGKSHQGAYNTDTMIVASFSPSNKTLTFLSVPRDLWVRISDKYSGRVNTILEYHLNKTKDLNTSLVNLKNKVSEIVGIDIPYYAMVDFDGFKKAIDILGGLPINVPERLSDTTYPDDNVRANQGGGGVNHLIIESGFQTMDGNTALKYARSRHSTSDFDRSSRQQAVISAVIDRLISSNGIANIGNLYNQYKESVVTNLTNKEIVGLSKYINDIKNKNSYTISSDCMETIKNMTAGCLLYSPNRDAFGGAAVLLQEGAKANSVSNYASIQKFSNIIFNLPEAKNSNIYIANAIDKKFAAKYGGNNGIGTSLGTSMKKYGLNVINSINSDNKFSQNYIVLLGTGDYSQAVTVIQKFVTGAVVNLDYLFSLGSGYISTGFINQKKTGFEKFDKLRKEMAENSGMQKSGVINTGFNIYNIKDIDQLYDLNSGVLVVIGNQYLIEN